jgi:biopolymer transport protein ExbD
MQKSDSDLASLSELMNQVTEADEESRLTIFAPTDAAFQEVSDVMRTLDFETLSDVRFPSRLVLLIA